MKRQVAGKKSKFILLWVMVVAVGFSSCRTARDVTTGRVRPLAPEKLLKEAEQNAFDYNDLSIRRINCQFSNSESKTNFRINLKALKDEKILAAISKMNIPVGRVLLTPDSVRYVNYLDRNYFLDDYTFLSKFLNFNITFETIQSIISNNIFSYQNHSQDDVFQNFDSSVENGKYVLKSADRPGIFKRARMRNNSPGRNSGIFNQESTVSQKMVFNPRNFALEELVVDDRVNDWKMEVAFSDFVKVEKKNYPGFIHIKMTSPDDIIELKIKLNGFSVEEIDAIELNIPDKYEEISVN